MPRGSYTLRQQVAERGAFASVTLDVRDCDPPTRVVIAPDGNVPEHYIHSANTGVQFALTQLILEHQEPPSLEISIKEIIGTAADTLEMMIVYAAANALCDALNVSLYRPVEIDIAKGVITFPLGRDPNT